MPSPIGHALAGVAAAWAADLVPGDRAWRTAPAIGLVVPTGRQRPHARCAPASAPRPISISLFVAHRTVTHSVGAVVVRRPVRRGAGRQRAAAGRAHRADVRRRVRHRTCCSTGSAPTAIRRAGIQVLWPFSDEWFISGCDLFRQTARRASVTRAADADERRARSLQEIAILGPIVARAVASTCKSPGPTCARDGRPRPSGAVADTAGTSDRRGRRAAR